MFYFLSAHDLENGTHMQDIQPGWTAHLCSVDVRPIIINSVATGTI